MIWRLKSFRKIKMASEENIWLWNYANVIINLVFMNQSQFLVTGLSIEKKSVYNFIL